MPYSPPTPPASTALTDVALNPAAPLSAVQPSTNPLLNAGIGLGPVAAVNLATTAVAGPEVSLIAGALNVFLDWAKNLKWFPERHTVPIMIVLSIAIAVLVWHFLQDDLTRLVQNACGIIVNAHTNYHGSQISGVGILKPTSDENRR